MSLTSSALFALTWAVPTRKISAPVWMLRKKVVVWPRTSLLLPLLLLLNLCCCCWGCWGCRGGGRWGASACLKA